MKKKTCLLLTACLFIIATHAQEKNSKRNVSNKYQQLISFGIDLPTGDFSATHFMGLAVDFTFSKNRFGQLPVIPTYRVNIFCNLGIAYYFGKNENVSSFPYNYPGFTFLHLYPGLLFIADKKITISLAAGPALRMYDGNSRFNLGAILSGTYYLNNKIGITPSLQLMKESGADPLLAASLKGAWAF